MNYKKILFGDEARKKIIRGVNITADAVINTLGPKGQTVIFEESIFPTITKDGVTVAQQVFLKDKFENMGVMLSREAAENTNREAGDGTTSTVVLLRAIVNEGNKYIATGINPVLLKRGMEGALSDVITALDKRIKRIETRDEKKNIATISANNDPELGEMITGVLEEIGVDGIVSVTNSNSLKTEVEYVKGTKIHSGYVTPYYINDRKKLTSELDDVSIIITTDRVVTQNQLVSVIQDLVSKGKTKIVLLAPTIEGTALSFLVQNQLGGKFSCVPVVLPIGGPYQEDLYLDLAALLNATIVGESESIKLEDAKIEQCGLAGHSSIGRDFTIITEASGNVEERISGIKEQLKEEKDIFIKEQLRKRLGRLSGSVANIKVGGASETEQIEIRYRIEDALNSTKSAIEDGIVEGGGTSLLRVGAGLKCDENVSPEYKAGYNVVVKALREPALAILANAGLPGEAIIEKVLTDKTGYNVLTDVYQDLFEAGVVDPVRCVKNEITNAVATASTLLTSNVAIANEEEEK